MQKDKREVCQNYIITKPQAKLTTTHHHIKIKILKIQKISESISKEYLILYIYIFK